MRRSTKFIATIIAMCLVVTLGVIGIFAVKTLNMTVGGNITFSADGLALEVSQGQFKTTENASYSNITTQNNKLQAFAIDTNTKLESIQDKIDSWSGLELQLDSKGDAILYFSVTNKMTTPLYVYVSTQLGTNTNNNMDLIVSPNGTEIGAGVTTNFTIKFDIIDTNINAGLAGFNVAVSFAKESLVAAQNKIDQATGLPTAQVDYYYVEMGTYNGQPVRWRYVADKNGTRYDGTSAVTSLSGYYVLETEINLMKQYLNPSKYDQTTYKYLTQGYQNINANDYGLSDMRAYLTSSEAGGFMSDFEISENNPIYSLIAKRTLTDLYTNITKTGKTIDSTNTSYCLSLTGDKDISHQSDKFWLMSRAEIEMFFESFEAAGWGEDEYWLRTPAVEEATYWDCAFYIGHKGTSHSSRAVNKLLVRPAFKIA